LFDLMIVSSPSRDPRLPIGRRHYCKVPGCCSYAATTVFLPLLALKFDIWTSKG
jgi:hypothetical protein